MRSDVHNANSGKFGDMDSPVLRDYRREVLRQSDDSNTAITLTVAQSGAIMLLMKTKLTQLHYQLLQQET